MAVVDSIEGEFSRRLEQVPVHGLGLSVDVYSPDLLSLLGALRQRQVLPSYLEIFRAASAALAVIRGQISDSVLTYAVRAAGRVALAAETSSPDPLRGELVGIGLSVGSGAAWYLPFGHVQPFELTFEGEDPAGVRNLPPASHSSMSGLTRLLEDPAIEKVGHDLKRSALALSRAGVRLAGF